VALRRVYRGHMDILLGARPALLPRTPPTPHMAYIQQRWARRRRRRKTALYFKSRYYTFRGGALLPRFLGLCLNEEIATPVLRTAV